MLLAILKRASVLFCVLICALTFLSFFYQLTLTTIDENRFPAPGKLIDIGGYRIHFNITGEAGPLVVLDAGMGCNSLDWILVEPEIAKFARVLTFDRAGYGWSDPGPEPRTSGQIIKELHQLLMNLDIPGPYIFVGHSFGGLNVRLYASEYPKDVLGLVLVDASHEEQMEKLPFIPYETYREILHALSIFAPFGSHRWLIPYIFGSDLKTYPLAQRALRNAKQCQNKTIRTAYAELRDFTESLKQMKAKAHALFDTPLYVLSAGKVDPIPGFDQETMNLFLETWSKLQKKLAAQSKKGKNIVASESGHMIHWEQPELVIEAVRDLVRQSQTTSLSNK
ncbi:putative Hydrolase, alpha/beta fold family [Chlamydiales bacterium STE3]|nr:putative Hydrolase, alpha/beta fold family [Chlamydiales bacterium STE3]